MLKRLRNSERWLRLLCIELLRENVAYRLEEAISRTIRIVDGTIVREPGKTGSQWRILRRLGKLRYRSGSYPGIFTHSRAFVRQKSTA
jgi:hypothetical protein